MGTAGLGKVAVAGEGIQGIQAGGRRAEEHTHRGDTEGRHHQVQGSLGPLGTHLGDPEEDNHEEQEGIVGGRQGVTEEGTDG